MDRPETLDIVAEGTPLERAQALAPLIAEDAYEAEQLGRLTDRVAGAMRAARMFQMLLPVSAGGLGATRTDLFLSVEAIGRADGSAAWCCSACNTVTSTAWKGLPAEGRAEVFGAGPTAGWTAFAPRTHSTPVEGGFQISGDWTFGSGSSVSDWVFVTALLGREGDQSFFRGHFVPKAQTQIAPGSWEVMGLRATHSVDWTITDVFVPAHRTFEFTNYSPVAPEGVSIRDGGRLNQVGLTAFACGAASAALDELMGQGGVQRMTSAAPMAEDQLIQFGVGELEARLRAARVQFMTLIAKQDEAIAAGGLIDNEMGFQFTQGAHVLTRVARDIVLFCFDHARTGVVYSRDPLQRRLRDVLTGLKHASFSLGMISRIGKARMGGEYGARGF